ncbi:MAG: hypothetical protein H8D87_00935 [Deltaproteobacteria bacterium]|uniref:hypothetical protein n=1 Tax=Desulfobacula sp. TaxID=2593537 RepID=UPI0019C1DA86|nr:hypothetical protein [Candidatus Desulfobacula maris]MBL6994403.1 hypothetical protein [Desulfobacula sp.]
MGKCLIATPKENIQRFKKKLAGLKRSKRFIDWRGSSGFALDLTMLLQDLKAGVDEISTLVPRQISKLGRGRMKSENYRYVREQF